MDRFVSARILLVSLLVNVPAMADEPAQNSVPHPLSEQQRAQIIATNTEVLTQTPAPKSADRPATQLHSQRGDALLFLGRFAEAVSEYQAMAKIDPELDASHWRLGIALFFANQPKTAVAQFEKYHTFDNVDRENGIWRYLSQYKASGAIVAKKELLLYEKDDREPFPAVYKLFDGSLTPEAALAGIPKDLPAAERDKRLFYTELYIGLHMVVKKDLAQAQKYLSLSVSRNWPRTSGFGPNYMWHVGRVQLNELRKTK